MKAMKTNDKDRIIEGLQEQLAVLRLELAVLPLEAALRDRDADDQDPCGLWEADVGGQEPMPMEGGGLQGEEPCTWQDGYDWGAAQGYQWWSHQPPPQYNMPMYNMPKTQRKNPRDLWTPPRIRALLGKLGEFQLVDESRSGSLKYKGRGVWTIESATKDLELREQLQEMICSFWSFDVPFELPKLAAYANNGGRHELVQKMLAVANAQQKTDLANKLDDQIKNLAKDQFGCLVLQQLLFDAIKAVDTSVDRQAHHDFAKGVLQMMTKDLLEPDVLVEASNDEHANHVVQKLVQLMLKVPFLAQENLRAVFQAVSANAATLAVNRQGCRIVNRLLESCHEDCHELAEKLLDDDTFRRLATSGFGNYVVQHIMTCVPKFRLAVLTNVVTNFKQQAAGHYDYLSADAPDHVCFYAMHTSGRHVVKFCLDEPPDFCPESAKVLADLKQLVLKKNGTPNDKFQCLRGRATLQLLERLKSI